MRAVSTWPILIGICFLGFLCACQAHFVPKRDPKSIRSPESNRIIQIFAPTGNLIKNPGFESGLSYWEDWGSTFEPSTYNFDGNYALKILGQGGCGQEMIYRLQTGGTYQLKVFARVGSAADDASVGIRFFDLSNRTLGEIKKSVKSTNWQQVVLNFTLPERVSSAKVFAWSDSEENSEANFDDFSLTQISPPEMPPSLPEIANPENWRPLGPKGNWMLVFSDEFTSGALNETIWNNGLWFQSTLNNELQAYRPENTQLTDGRLNLVTERRSTSTLWGAKMNYASGAVTTRNKFSFIYGAVEARIKTPKGSGLYSAFWLLPEGKRSPPEIDLLEVLGSNPSRALFNYHYLDGDGVPTAIPGDFRGPDLSSDFHTFTLEWTPTNLVYYVDGIERHRFASDFILRDPAFLILNLAVGGTLAGTPDASTEFPQAYQIDYVRIWQ